MGCGGSEEKKKETVVVEGDEGTHLSLHATFKLQEGKTKEDLIALYDKELEVAKACAGCLHFQVQITDESIAAGTCLLTEKYVDGAAHLEMNKMLDAAGLVQGENGIFATYNFTELKFGLLKSDADNADYQGLLKEFGEVTGNPCVVIIKDDFMPCKCMKADGVIDMEGSNHVVLTATVGLTEGKTMEDIIALYKKEVVVAKACEGCLHFALEMDEDSMKTGTAVLHEMYTSDQGHLQLNKDLDAAGLVTGEDGIFATYKFNNMQFGLRESSYSEDYKGLMSQFEQVAGKPPVMDVCECAGLANLDGK